MGNARVTRADFSVERSGEGAATSFVYLGRRRIELVRDGTVMTLTHSRFDEEVRGRVNEVVDAVWELAEPGVLDTIEISYRAGDPHETVTVRSRS